MRKIFAIILLSCVMSLHATMQEVTYTITSKTSVLAEGHEPIGSMATFEQTGTGQKGQMTAGNATLFTLTGLQGVRLNSVTLQMRSNSKAGAGELRMTVGEDVLWEIEESSFADKQWNGDFTTAFVPIEWHESYTFEDDNTLSIQITASENSLYVSSYTLTYATEPARPYTVEFHTGSEEIIAGITESRVGEGIILPECSSADSVWYFVGWTESLVSATNDKNELPKVYAAGERYYPVGNQVLYALYVDVPEAASVWLQDTILDTGYYLLVDSIFEVMPYGNVDSKGRISVSDVTITERDENGYCVFPKNDYLEDYVYFIDFLPDSLATIQHVTTGNFIGYPRTETGTLTKDSVAWNYRVIEQHSVVFYRDFGTNWVQLRAKPDNSGNVFYQAYKTSYSKSANLLFNIIDCPALLTGTYTSSPWGTGLGDIFSASIVISSEGIINSEHLPLCIYTVSGLKLLTTCDNISFAQFPRGVYLLQVADREVRKIYVE